MAPSTYIRFAHREGLASVCYVPFEDGGVRLATAGVDGDLRLWVDIDDDDPDSHHLGESLSALAVAPPLAAGGAHRLLLGTDYDGVAAFSLPTVKPDGVLTRFTASVTDLSVRAGLLAAASCDMTVRVTTLDLARERKFDQFAAPVLSVKLSPAGKQMLTACCDGFLIFWDAVSGKKLAAHQILPVCNDVLTSESYVRCDWSSDGASAAAPVDRDIRLFSGDNWQESGRLSSPLVTHRLTVCAFSPCGKYLMAATTNGLILEWNMSTRSAHQVHQHEENFKINVLVWHPDGDQIAFSDNMGQLGVTAGVRETRLGALNGTAAKKTSSADKELMDMDELERAISGDDDDDVDDLMEAVMKGEQDFNDSNSAAFGHTNDDDDDDENAISLRKLKAQSGFTQFGGESQDGQGSEATAKTAAAGSKPAAPPLPAPAPALPKQQPAFQPGSTPAHLDRRFMVWNSVGAVVAHDNESSIDVEFHDTATYHPLHINNVFGHTLAALSDAALLLAAPSSADAPAKIQCLHFGSWDSTKEWYMDLPVDEEVDGLAVGGDWLAFASSSRRLRVLSLTGVQRLVVSLSGPLLCLASWQSRLLVLQHAGVQSVTASVLAVERGGCRQVLAPLPVPVSPGATICWAGMTDQGSPCVHDTAGVLQLLTGRQGAFWTPLGPQAADTSARLFVVGLDELEGQLRCVVCRGSRYPAVLPRPVMTLLPLRLPFCELETDRGRMEEEATRLQASLQCLRQLDAAGYDVQSVSDERQRARAVLLTKLFALACKTDHQHRALDVASLLDDVGNLEALAGYASRQRRQKLVERLMKLAETLEESPSPTPAEDPPTSSDFFSQQSVDLFPSAADPAEDDQQQQRPQRDSAASPDLTASDPPSIVLPGSIGNGAAPTFVTTPSFRNPFKCAPVKSQTSSNKGASVFDELKATKQPSSKRPLADIQLRPAKVKKPKVKRQASL